MLLVDEIFLTPPTNSQQDTLGKVLNAQLLIVYMYILYVPVILPFLFVFLAEMSLRLQKLNCIIYENCYSFTYLTHESYLNQELNFLLCV